jgi:arsenate reductase
MAEAFLSDLAGDRFEITSAGSEATALDPDAIAAMRELGIDISGHQSKSVTSYLGHFTFVITLCDRQQERTCPIFPGAIWRHEWHLDDPALADSPEKHRHRVRDQLREHVVQFVTEHQ